MSPQFNHGVVRVTTFIRFELLEKTLQRMRTIFLVSTR